MADKTENKILLEREYTIPLRRAWLKAAEYKRVRKSVKTIRKFIARHMKVPERDESKVKINKWLNHELWFRGIKHPPAKIKVKVKKYLDHVDVELAEIPEKVRWLIAKEAKLLAPPKEKAKKGKDDEKKPDEKTEAAPEKNEDKKEKIEAVKETGLQHAREEMHQHKHETPVHKDKTTPRRMALQK